MIEGVEADLFRGGVTGCLRGSKCWIGAAHAGQAPGLLLVLGLLLRPFAGFIYYRPTGGQACRAPGDTAAIDLKRRSSDPGRSVPCCLWSRLLLVSVCC